MKWYVLYTKPKWEKKVANKLLQIGITAYCPVITKIRQWSDRKKKVEMPLFSSYIFVQIDDKDRNSVFVAQGVIRYLFWLGKPAVVKNKEIETIQDWLAGSGVFEVKVESWRPGDQIILEQGFFKDQQAIVKEVKDKEYVLVLKALGCLLRVNKGKSPNEPED